MFEETSRYHSRIIQISEKDLEFEKTGRRDPWRVNIYRHEEPRAFMRVLEDRTKPCTYTYTPDKLRDRYYQLDQLRKDTPDAPFHRLIIMEDVDPRFAELVGVELNIPPEFWLAHSDERFCMRPLDGMFNQRGRSTYWKLPVPQVRANSGPIPKAQYCWFEAGSFERLATKVQPGAPIFTFSNLVSFWGHKHHNGWTGT